MAMTSLLTIGLAIAALFIETIPADAQGISQRVMRALPPVQSALPMGMRMVPARRANPGGMRNGLPPTNMDSFVYESGGKAWHIYGDEGVYSIPPFMEFTKEHRIEEGISGRRRKGLTTGHGSHLPDAWGGDEWVDGPEWSDSGAGGTQSQYQPFEMVQQDSPARDMYQTPPFVDDQSRTTKPLPRITPDQINDVMTAMTRDQDTNQQAMFGRQLAKPGSQAQGASFNWP